MKVFVCFSQAFKKKVGSRGGLKAKKTRTLLKQLIASPSLEK